MASSSDPDDLEIINESDALLMDQEPVPGGSSFRPGYEMRRELLRGRSFVPSYGTYLGIKDLSEEDGMPMDNPVTVALHLCNTRVLTPYRRLLLTVGWHPVFEDAVHCWQRLINVLHPILVLLLVFLGYVIQYAACFRRDSAGQHTHWYIVYPPNATNMTQATYPECQGFLISQYIIPDLLHSAAYAYCFCLLRGSDSEQLPTLVERVFLQTSPTQTGFLSQGRLISTMRLLLFGGVLWILLSLGAQVLHVAQAYNSLGFSFLAPSLTDASRAVLVTLMLLGFVALDVVYCAVVISYSVQCVLLIYYTEGLQEKLRQKMYDVQRSMKEISEVEKHLKQLNYSTALAVSIVLFNFGAMACLGLLSLMAGRTTTPMMIVSTSLSVVFWLLIMAVPIIQAARLSAAAHSLRKVGHEVRARPYVYQDTPDSQLDSLLLYTSSLNLRAKLFLVPVHTSILSLLFVICAFITLLLFQTGIVSVWLHNT